MDEIKRLTLLCQAFQMQRDDYANKHAFACVELTDARDIIAERDAEISDLKAPRPIEEHPEPGSA